MCGSQSIHASKTYLASSEHNKHLINKLYWILFISPKAAWHVGCSPGVFYYVNEVLRKEPNKKQERS
jgi:hypothetical protein